jgi:hypothetical protein
MQTACGEEIRLRAQPSRETGVERGDDLRPVAAGASRTY